MTPISDSEISTASAIMSKLNPGILPFEIFTQIARLTVLTTIVLLPIQSSSNQIKIYLPKRTVTDKYHNWFHPAGTILLPTDTSIATAIKRLVSSELTNIPCTSDPVFAGVVFDQNYRGKEISLLHWVELAELESQDNLFACDRLPQNTIPDDLKRISQIIDHFKQAKHL